MLGSSPVFARDPMHKNLINVAGEWSGGFDTASGGAADVLTSTPTMSQEVIDGLQQAVAKYAEIVARGGWPVIPSGRKLHIGMHDPVIATLRQRLTISGDLAPIDGVQEAFDTYVDSAVRRFQARHGIQVDGVIGESSFVALNIPATARLTQIATNLTRMKMLVSEPLPKRFVMVNIPAARVEAVEEGRIVSLHTAVVGRADRPSPIVKSKIHEINFHPFWTVPVSIIRRDLIPLMQEDPEYLSRNRIRIFDSQGVELPPEQIDWTTEEATRYLFRQDPFEENSLGTVKINFPSPDAVYMHDTPDKSLFNDDSRFDSSGCVRIQDISELVMWLLRDTPGQTRRQVDAQFRSGERLSRTGDQLDVRLADPVPVYWIYITAWAAGEGVVNFRGDNYDLDGLERGAPELSTLTL